MKSDLDINKALDFVLQTAEQTRDFVADQAPLVAGEIIQLTFVGGVIQAVIGLVMVVFTGIVARGVWRIIPTEEDRPELVLSVLLWCVLAFFSLIVGGVMAYQGTKSALQAAIAPRTVVIDYLRSHQ